MPHQLRDADLDVTVEKNQRQGGGRSATAEQPDLSAQGALALQWHGGARCTSQLRQQEGNGTQTWWKNRCISQLTWTSVGCS